MYSAYRENHHDLSLTSHYNSKVIPDLESPESFVDKDVLNLRCRDKSCRRSSEICAGGGRGLYAEGA